MRFVGSLLACFVWLLATAEKTTSEPQCIQWRATKNCDPHAAREPRKDLPCSHNVPKGSAGYCECENRRRARESECNHHVFNCEDACKQEHSAELEYPEGHQHVTYGSSLKLVHEESRYRLHSHEIAYGTGSRQQSVTAHKARNDANSYWIIKEGHGEDAKPSGSKVQCDAVIRLEHSATQHNLHSHKYKAPLTSSHGEVSAFGDNGAGDVMDNWILDCVEAHQCTAEDQCEDGQHWMRGQLVRLRHADTGKYLFSSHTVQFDDSNCPNCPINGQQEISAISKKTDGTLWFADEGLYVSQ